MHSALRGENAARYHSAVSGFKSELSRTGYVLEGLSETELDYHLADHIIDFYEQFQTAEGIGKAALLLAAMSKRRPRHRYMVAWKCLDVWRTRVPPRQAPTVPIELAFGAVSWLTLAGMSAEACITLCFAGLLRISEALTLKWSQMHFMPQQVILVLGITKCGLEQKVVLDHPTVVLAERLSGARR